MPDGLIRYWQTLTTDEVAAMAPSDPVAILPLAAIEQHGPHLPLSTDLDIGLGLLEAAYGHLDDDVEAWVLPPIAVGTSDEHAYAPGTLGLSQGQLIESIRSHGAALARSGVRRLVLANSHGGNRHAMDAAGLALRDDHRMLVVKASYFRFARPADVELPDGEWRHGLHGGAVETAMMMHLRPDLVRQGAVERFPSLGEELESIMRRLGPEGEASFSWLARDLNPQGVAGDATLATESLGAQLVRHYARALAEVIVDAGSFPLDRLDAPVSAPVNAPDGAP